MSINKEISKEDLNGARRFMSCAQIVSKDKRTLTSLIRMYNNHYKEQLESIETEEIESIKTYFSELEEKLMAYQF